MNTLITYPSAFQIRKNCIIEYIDPSYYQKGNKPQTEAKKPITQSGEFSSTSKRKMKKTLDLWIYSNEIYKPKYSFVTLTLSGKMDKNENHYKMLKKFIEEMQYRYAAANYVWKAEYQENGNVHYHILFDEEIQWKSVRKCWNKIQSKYVDEYQLKMKLKYKKGYYYDTEMKDSNGNTVNEETQLNRYKKGNKANFRNPNSTDVKIETEVEKIEKYINKYLNKKEEEKQNTDTKKINRYWGCNDKLRLLKYAVISELSINPNTLKILKENTIKEIKENNTVKCSIINKIVENTLKEVEEKQLKENQNILQKSKPNNYTLIEKDNKKYNILFELN